MTVDVAVENVIGQTIYSTKLGSFAPGAVQKKIDLPQSISKGIYFVKLTLNSKEKVIKLVKE